jgi:dienelactone hydrolase
VLPFVARLIDSLLTTWLAPRVRRPRGYRPPAGPPPDSPEAVVWPGPIVPEFTEQVQDGIWKFRVPSPVRSPWPESQTIHGRALGLRDARAALLILHGAYSEWTPCQIVGQQFAKHGFRVLIPAAPCHLERAPANTPNGAAFFWSTEALILGTAQWLAEVYGLIQGLRAQGVERVGLLGYSVGTQTAGLAASLWPDLDFVVLLAAVGHHLQSIAHSRIAARIWPWMRKVPAAEAALFDRWSPRYRQPAVGRIHFGIPLFDELQPTALQEDWWQAWGRPARWEYRYGHISLYFAAPLFRDLDAFAAGLRPPAALPEAGGNAR